MKTFRMIEMALVAILMSVSFVACSDDDEEEADNNYAEMIVGTWESDQDEEFSFKKDGTLVWTDLADSDYTVGGTWDIFGNLLTYKLVYGNHSETYWETIRELTTTRMVTFDEDNMETIYTRK